MATESGAVAVVNVWFEAPADSPADSRAFRARITYPPHPGDTARSIVLTDPHQLLDMFAAWIEAQRVHAEGDRTHRRPEGADTG